MSLILGEVSVASGLAGFDEFGVVLGDLQRSAVLGCRAARSAGQPRQRTPKVARPVREIAMVLAFGHRIVRASWSMAKSSPSNPPGGPTQRDRLDRLTVPAGAQRGPHSPEPIGRVARTCRPVTLPRGARRRPGPSLHVAAESAAAVTSPVSGSTAR
jgi:hypothetical protein